MATCQWNAHLCPRALPVTLWSLFGSQQLACKGYVLFRYVFSVAGTSWLLKSACGISGYDTRLSQRVLELFSRNAALFLGKPLKPTLMVKEAIKHSDLLRLEFHRGVTRLRVPLNVSSCQPSKSKFRWETKASSEACQHCLAQKLCPCPCPCPCSCPGASIGVVSHQNSAPFPCSKLLTSVCTLHPRASLSEATGVGPTQVFVSCIQRGTGRAKLG